MNLMAPVAPARWAGATGEAWRLMPGAMLAQFGAAARRQSGLRAPAVAGDPPPCIGRSGPATIFRPRGRETAGQP